MPDHATDRAPECAESGCMYADTHAEVERLDDAEQTLRADLVQVIRTQEELRAALRRAAGSMWEAHDWLTPGMKAGVGDARRVLQEAAHAALMLVRPVSESPEERHHRQLHDGELNQMPPEHE